MDIKKLLKGKEGERANAKEVYKWILDGMKYEDFCKIARLDFFDNNGGYPFNYQYMVDKNHDCKEAREDFIDYLCYKLIQNLDTNGVELI